MFSPYPFREYVDNPLIVSKIMSFIDNDRWKYRFVFTCLGRESDWRRLADMGCFIYHHLADDYIRRAYLRSRSDVSRYSIRPGIQLTADTMSEDMYQSWWWTGKLLGDYRSGDYETKLGMMALIYRRWTIVDDTAINNLRVPFSIILHVTLRFHSIVFKPNIILDLDECDKIPIAILCSRKVDHPKMVDVWKQRKREDVYRNSVPDEYITRAFPNPTITEKRWQAENVALSNPIGLLHLPEDMFMWAISLHPIPKNVYDNILSRISEWKKTIIPTDHGTEWSRKVIDDIINQPIDWRVVAWGESRYRGYR
jgi:hypothetical protein